MPPARHVVAAFATSITLSLASPGAKAGLPQVNLTVSWRVDDGLHDQRNTQVVQGQVIVDSRGQVIGRTGVGATVVQTTRQGQTAQMLQVLNGRQARLFVGQQVGRQSWQLVGMPATAGTGGTGGTGPGNTADAAEGNPTRLAPLGGWVVAQQVQWVDLGAGLTVRPSWGGGRQPVQLEIEARSSRAAPPGSTPGAGFAPDGQVQHSEVMTTLSVPLGQWVLLARSGQGGVRSQQRSGSAWSTETISQDGTQSLWVRVGTDPTPAPWPGEPPR